MEISIPASEARRPRERAILSAMVWKMLIIIPKMVIKRLNKMFWCVCLLMLCLAKLPRAKQGARVPRLPAILSHILSLGPRQAAPWRCGSSYHKRPGLTAVCRARNQQRQKKAGERVRYARNGQDAIFESSPHPQDGLPHPSHAAR